jgi:hypothetical protein
VALDVAPRHLQRLGRQLDGIDLRGGEGQRAGDRDAAAAGAQVEHALDSVGLEPGRESRLSISSAKGERGISTRRSTKNGSPANQASPVRYGRGHALDDAPLDQLEHRALLGLGEARGIELARQVVAEMQAWRTSTSASSTGLSVPCP